MKFEYVVQPSPDGLAEAYLLGEEFIAGEPSVLILGDNIFFGQNFTASLRGRRRAPAWRDGVRRYLVQDPERYGVVRAGPRPARRWASKEKPAVPSRRLCGDRPLLLRRPGQRVRGKTLKPSPRGELEITALNQVYLEAGELSVELLGRGFAWLDTGTHDSLIQAGEFIRAVEQRQGLRIGCLEEIAFRRGWIDAKQLRALADSLAKSEYGQYLRGLAERPPGREDLAE